MNLLEIKTKAIAKTWAYADESDMSLLLQAIPENYKLVRCPRRDNSGYGGVEIIFKDSLSVSRCQCLNFQSIEHLIIRVDLSFEHLVVWFSLQTSTIC